MTTGDPADTSSAASQAGMAVTGGEDNEEVIARLTSDQLDVARTGRDLDRLRALEARVGAAVRASRQPSTLRAYRSDWADFATWCAMTGLEALPAAPATVAAYLAEMAAPLDDRAPLAVATIERRKSAIAEAHKAIGEANPCLDELVRQVSKGVRRQLGVAPRHRKTGLSTADVRAIVEGLDPERPIDARDKALLLLGFATALRRGELVALTVGDVDNHPQGLLVQRRRSKTDPEAVGHQIEVAYGEHPDTCPVRAYRAWLDLAGITDGPVFRAVHKSGRTGDTALSDRTVARVIKKLVAPLGHDAADFAGHSLRRGFSTQASRNGAPDRTIAATTGHTSSRGLQPYIAEADTFTDPPSNYLGL